MKRFILYIVMFIAAAAPLAASAQQRQQRLSVEDRQKYLVEMRNQKHEFLIRELDLTREQQNAFFPIYDQMEDEINKISDETRQLEQKVADDPKASDTEIDAAARAVFEQKVREGNIEMEYFNKFKEILQPRQLLNLKNAERKFTQQLLRQHNRMKRN